MAEALKNMFSRKFLETFAGEFSAVYEPFDKRKFLGSVFDAEWEIKELKQRMRHITVCLHNCLPGGYKRNTGILMKAVKNFSGFLSMVFPDYVEVYGLDDPETSVAALELFTQHGSSEFAVRPFIIRYPGIMIPVFSKWAVHKNHHVRRLASEGMRPRLPWAIALPAFKKDPAEVIKVISLLKNDESDYVRRSVANCLNDISKDNPEIALKTAKSWYGNNCNTDRIVKHAMRGLLKKGNSEALGIFGFSKSKVKLREIELSSTRIKRGGELTFSFILETGKNPLKNSPAGNLRVEYSIDFITSTGRKIRKIFLIKEFSPNDQTIYRLKKRQSFKDLTTRKHFKGKHTLSIHVNGKVLAEKLFYLL